MPKVDGQLGPGIQVKPELFSTKIWLGKGETFQCDDSILVVRVEMHAHLHGFTHAPVLP